MKNEKTVEVLNSLITINNDRIEGYESASEATEEHDLKNLFGKLKSTSQGCKQELVKEVNSYGGDVAGGTKTSGKFFRVWMDVKAAITGKDRKAILDSCEYGEDNALATYDNALENDMEHLSPKQQAMIIGQKSSIKAEHDHVRAMRDALAK